MRRLLVLCLVMLTPVLAAKAQDLKDNDSGSQNVVTYAAPQPAATPAAAAATPQIFAASGAGPGTWEFSLGYQFNELHLNPNEGFHTSGYNVSFTRFFGNWFGIEGQTGFGYGKTGTGTVPNNMEVRTLFAGGGPHISFRGNSRVEPWAHGIVGWEHYRFNANGGPLYKNSSVGWLVGGGIDYHLSGRLALRGEGDYLGTQFFSSSHRNLEIVGGFVMTF